MTILSVAIPVYNFADFLPETLDSFADQPEAQDVEFVILDGGSTDGTPAVVSAYRERLPRLRYVRMPERGGIDRDMAKSVDAASGDYVWLFSGDDIAAPGSLARVLSEIESGHDLYLCKHMEWSAQDGKWFEYPVLDLDRDRLFDLRAASARAAYMALALNSEAFFSFIGGLVVKRSVWNSVPFEDAFDRTCWAHAGRLLQIMKRGMSLKYLASPLLYRRPDNDSFLHRGLIWRFGIAVDGYNLLADSIFGRESVEAFHIRRVLKREFGVWHLVMGKIVARLAPAREDARLNWRLVKSVYSDRTVADLHARFTYLTTSPEEFAYWNPGKIARLEAQYGTQFVPAPTLLQKSGLLRWTRLAKAGPVRDSSAEAQSNWAQAAPLIPRGLPDRR